VFSVASDREARSTRPAGGGIARLLRAEWLIVAAVTAVVAVNAAGLLGIAAARRGGREEAGRLFQVQTEAHARVLESRLSALRADLAFLAGSSALSRVAREEPRTSETDWRRGTAEATLLVFLRGHPEVKHLAVVEGRDRTWVAASRRGGVPVLWRARGEASPIADLLPVAEGQERRLRAVMAQEAATSSAAAPRVVVELEAGVLLQADEAAAGLGCRLRDASGRRLGPSDPPARDGRPAEGHRLTAEALVRAEGWSAPSPWSLSCDRDVGLGGPLEPVAARSRRALALNLVVMTLAVLLGVIAVQQARRRERLEAEARERLRVQELEQQLFHAERLGTVGRLAAGLAHELNNPLEGMANYLALARTHLGAGDSAALRRDLDLVRQGLERAAGIVRQVLDRASRADAPQTAVELTAVVQQAVDFVRSWPEFRGIDFQVEPPEGPLLVWGRPVMLGQVLLNLLRNACEAQPRGGEVRVKAVRQGTEGRIEVADRGPGVPASDRARIFEPFYSTKSSTGLGLSVCEAIVRQHHGRLELLEREGGGAAFALTLPLQERGEARPA
jgi:signal transduction histidine kinase